jgi:hypothetical protein
LEECEDLHKHSITIVSISSNTPVFFRILAFLSPKKSLISSRLWRRTKTSSGGARRLVYWSLSSDFFQFLSQRAKTCLLHGFTGTMSRFLLASLEEERRPFRVSSLLEPVALISSHLLEESEDLLLEECKACLLSPCLLISSAHSGGEGRPPFWCRFVCWSLCL